MSSFCLIIQLEQERNKRPLNTINMVNVKMTTQMCFIQKLKIKYQYYQHVFTWSLNQCADLALRFSLGGVLSLCVALSIEGKLEG